MADNKDIKTREEKIIWKAAAGVAGFFGGASGGVFGGILDFGYFETGLIGMDFGGGMTGITVLVLRRYFRRTL